MACPFTAATTGTGSANIWRTKADRSGTKRSTYSAPPSTMRNRSTPAEKMLPVPVTITARAAPSAFISRTSASSSSTSMALAFPCASRRVRMPSSSSRSIIVRVGKGRDGCRAATPFTLRAGYLPQQARSWSLVARIAREGHRSQHPLEEERLRDVHDRPENRAGREQSRDAPPGRPEEERKEQEGE